MTAAVLNPQLRSLIDARLDAIDRILRADVGWSERRSIVGEVETQIFEFLGRRSATPAEEDVLAVLGAMDPPEAYLPDEVRERSGTAAPAARHTTDWRTWAQETLRVGRRFGRGAICVLGLVVVNGVVLTVIAASEGFIPWLVTLAALAWLNYEGVRRYRAWSAAHRGNAIDTLRYGLAAWLVSKGGAQAT